MLIITFAVLAVLAVLADDKAARIGQLSLIAFAVLIALGVAYNG
jgi:hypothetical protein